MKKSLMLLAAAATIVACSKTDNFKETAESPIDFTNVYVEKSTKGVISSATDLRTPGFGVFGVKTPKTGATDQVFGQLSSETSAGGGTKVTYNSSAWEYAQKRYWDKEATRYDFFAYAPYNTITNNVPLIGTIGWSKANPSTSFTITDFTQKSTKADMVDLLTSYVERVGSANYTNNVSFAFAHILSNIHIKMSVSQALKDDETVNPVSVTSVTLGAIKMKGSYAYSNSAYGWTVAATPTVSFSAEATKNNNTEVFAAGELTTTPQDVPGLFDLLFVPQTLPTETGTEYVINVTYKIADEVFNKEIKLNQFTKTVDENEVASSIWQPAYQYNYSLVIGPTPIIFGDPSIGTWTEDTYTYVIE